jgi:hypothetical protein
MLRILLGMEPGFGPLDLRLLNGPETGGPFIVGLERLRTFGQGGMPLSLFGLEVRPTNCDFGGGLALRLTGTLRWPCRGPWR